MSTGGPDLFVVCKSCGSEVSPYITECPYCGNRLRKRAPKLDREGRVAEKRRRLRAGTTLSRLRPGEIPGIRPELRPYASIALVLTGIVGALIWRTTLLIKVDLIVDTKPVGHWWRVVTAAFTYDNAGVAFVVLGAVALFGWLIERRHGPLAVLVLFGIGAIGGVTAATIADPSAVVLAGNGGALALLSAWAMGQVVELRQTGEIEADTIGAAVIAAVVALTPLVDPNVSWVADGVGVLTGLALGLPLAVLRA